MRYESSISIVQAWQDAANAQDVVRLLQLSAPDIEIVGPRGSGRGHQLLRDWLGRAGLHLTTLRTFARGNVVVLEQRGVWHSLDNGDVVGERQLASSFRVDGQQVTQFARCDTLDEALAQAELKYDDEIKPG